MLIRIIEFLTTLDVEAKEIFAKRVEGLAKVHSKRTIRPWMYSVFIEVCIGGLANAPAHQVQVGR